MLNATQPSMPPERAIAPAASGHFDELRGTVAASLPESSESCAEEGTSDAGMAAPWSEFFGNLDSDGLGDLNHRAASLERQIRDNGVTYNVYADTGGPQRPWSLDLFPLIVTPESWQQIEAGVLQRVCLLDQVMADVYGP